MPDLEMLLRDVRPAPDPVWAENLDAKVAARFPKAAKRRFWRVSFLSVRQQIFAMGGVGLVAGLAALLVITNLGTYTSTSSMDLPTATSEAPESAGDSAGGSSTAKKSKGADTASSLVPQTASGGSSRTAAASPGRGRAVLSNATLTLTTRPGEVETTTDRAIRITDALGGFVQSSTTSMRGSTASAELTLKLPSDKLDAGIAQLSKLGHVASRSQQAEDVTDQRESLQAAVRDARADRDGLRSRLSKAATDKERSRLRGLLDRASRRVTARGRDVAQLNQSVSYATVDLSIEGTRKSGAAPVPGGRWTPGDAVKDAGRALEVIAGVLVVGLAILLPLGVLAGLAAYANRGLTRRRRERALEAS
jgi:hypothetical protein